MSPEAAITSFLLHLLVGMLLCAGSGLVLGFLLLVDSLEQEVTCEDVSEDWLRGRRGI